MHVVHGYHHALWFRQHWKLDGIVGGGAVFAITYSILNAVQNKTLNSKVLNILRERATPMTSRRSAGSWIFHWQDFSDVSIHCLVRD